MTTVAAEISNGIIAVLTGVILYGINRIFKWARSIDKRLDRIEKTLITPAPEARHDR
jgi:hypothetical protein